MLAECENSARVLLGGNFLLVGERKRKKSRACDLGYQALLVDR